MKHHLKYFTIILILMLSVGFAALTTSIFINGDVELLAVEDDFSVVFTDSSSEEGGISYISPDGSSLIYSTKNLVEVGDEAVLHYTVTNESSSYDADVEFNLSDKDGKAFDSEYVSITNSLPLDSSLTAKSSTEGMLTVKLLKASQEDMTIDFQLFVDADAVERDTIVEAESDSFNFNNLEPGLYDSTNALLASWDELQNVYGLDIEQDADVNTAFDEIDEIDKNSIKALYDRVESSQNITTAVLYYSLLIDYIRVDGDYTLGNIIKNNPELSEAKTLVIGNNVTRLGNNSLAFLKNISNIYVPSNITELGKEVFEGSKKLSNVTLDCNISKIPDSTFFFDLGLNDLIIPEGVTDIGENALGFAKAKSISLPSTFNKFEDNDFPILTASFEVNENNAKYSSDDGIIYSKDMSELILYPPLKRDSTYTLPKSVYTITKDSLWFTEYLKHLHVPSMHTIIQNSAINSNMALEDITIDGAVHTVGGNSFSSNPKLTSIIIKSDEGQIIDVDGVLYSKDMQHLLYYPEGKTDTSYTIINGVNKIEDGAIVNNKYLQELVIPEGVTTLDEDSIQKDKKLTTIHLPSTLSNIRNRVFQDTNIVDIILAEGNTNYKVVDNVLFTYDGSKIVYYSLGLTNEYYEIPEGVTTLALDGWISMSVFYKNEYLKKIKIPSSVNELSGSLFDDIVKLEYIDIDENNKNYISIDGVVYDKTKTSLIAYPNNRKATTYTVLSGVVSMDDYAFSDSKYLSEVILPGTLKTIGSHTFNSSGITKVTIPASVISIGYDAFDSSKITSAIFEDPNGWKRGDSSISADDLSDPSIAAKLLIKGEYGKPWTKESTLS